MLTILTAAATLLLLGQTPAAKPQAGIQWFASVSSGFAEAKRTARPILLLSAAPHCAGVPGIW